MRLGPAFIGSGPGLVFDNFKVTKSTINLKTVKLTTSFRDQRHFDGCSIDPWL